MSKSGDSISVAQTQTLCQWRPPLRPLVTPCDDVGEVILNSFNPQIFDLDFKNSEMFLTSERRRLDVNKL